MSHVFFDLVSNRLELTFSARTVRSISENECVWFVRTMEGDCEITLNDKSVMEFRHNGELVGSFITDDLPTVEAFLKTIRCYYKGLRK